MSLLEGHADVVMDGVGPGVVPTVERDPGEVHVRRAGPGRLDRVLRRLLGLDAKMRQYRDGAAFCRAVIDGSAWTASTGSGPRRRRCRPATRSPTRRPGSRRVTRSGRPHADWLGCARRRWLAVRPRPARRPAVRPCGGPGRPADRRSCWSPAPAAPTRSPSPPPLPSWRRGPACAPAAVIVDHGLQAGLRRSAAAARGRAAVPASGSTRRLVAAR